MKEKRRRLLNLYYYMEAFHPYYLEDLSIYSKDFEHGVIESIINLFKNEHVCIPLELDEMRKVIHS